MDLVREDTVLGNKKVVVGDKLHDLVLESLGKVYIRYGNSYKKFDEFITTVSKATSNPTAVSIVASKPLSTTGYKDATFLYVEDEQCLYLVWDSSFILLLNAKQASSSLYVEKAGDTMTGQLVIETSDAPLIVTSTALVENLNSNYLNGYTDDEFAKKKEDETIRGTWTFKESTKFLKNVQVLKNLDVVGNITQEGDSFTTSASLQSPVFVSGFTGSGWKLDAATNTLTIDNLIVRGVLLVFELLINKISATNGSLWVTDAYKIETIIPVTKSLTIPTDDVGYTMTYTISTEEKNTYNNSGVNTRDITDWEVLESLYEGTSIIELGNDSGITISDLLAATMDFVHQSNDVYTQYTIDLYYKYFANNNLYLIASETESDSGLFRIGDILKCLRADLEAADRTVVKQYHALVLGYFGEYTLIQMSVPLAGDACEPAVKDAVVRIGNICNTQRLGSLYLTSSEDESPYLDVLTHVNRPDYSVVYPTAVLEDNEIVGQENIPCTLVRVGNLNGITDSTSDDNYGLYGRNVYLYGEFKLDNGQSVVEFTKDSITLQIGSSGIDITSDNIVLDSDKIHIKNGTETAAMFEHGQLNADLINVGNIEVTDLVAPQSNTTTKYKLYHLHQSGKVPEDVATLTSDNTVSIEADFAAYDNEEGAYYYYAYSNLIEEDNLFEDPITEEEFETVEYEGEEYIIVPYYSYRDVVPVALTEVLKVYTSESILDGLYYKHPEKCIFYKVEKVYFNVKSYKAPLDKNLMHVVIDGVAGEVDATNITVQNLYADSYTFTVQTQPKIIKWENSALAIAVEVNDPNTIVVESSIQAILLPEASKCLYKEYTFIINKTTAHPTKYFLSRGGDDLMWYNKESSTAGNKNLVIGNASVYPNIVKFMAALDGYWICTMWPEQETTSSNGTSG